jgi:hypothetical protein
VVCWKEPFDSKPDYLAAAGSAGSSRSEPACLPCGWYVGERKSVCEVAQAFLLFVHAELVIAWMINSHAYLPCVTFPIVIFKPLGIECFWASISSILEVTWFRVGFVCVLVFEVMFPLLAYLGRALERSLVMSFILCFCFPVFVKDFRWKTQSKWEN